MYNSGFNDGEALGTNNIGQPRQVTNRQRNEHNRKQPNLQDSPPPSYNDVIEADNINSAYNRDVSSVTGMYHEFILLLRVNSFTNFTITVPTPFGSNKVVYFNGLPLQNTPFK